MAIQNEVVTGNCTISNTQGSYTFSVNRYHRGGLATVSMNWGEVYDGNTGNSLSNYWTAQFGVVAGSALYWFNRTYNRGATSGQGSISNLPAGNYVIRVTRRGDLAGSANYRFRFSINLGFNK